MPRPSGNGAESDTGSLQRLYDLSVLALQRPGNIGAGLKVLEMLTDHGFKPKGGGQA